MKLIAIIIIPIMLCGCATPGIELSLTRDSAKFEPMANNSWLGKIFPASLPAGEYTVEENEHGVKASANTKTEMKLVDLNMAKLGQ